MDWISLLEPTGNAWSREMLRDEHASEPELVGASVRSVGEGPTAWAVQAARRIIARLRVEGTAVGVPRISTGFEIQACETGLLGALAVLHRGTVDELSLRSEPMLRIARTAVRQGMAVATLIHRVWASHAASQDELLAAMDAVVPVSEQLRVIQQMNSLMFEYGNAYVRALTDAYEAERATWRGRIPEEQRLVLSSILEGAAPPVHAEQVLGTSFTGGHLHALAWARSAGFVDERDAQHEAWALEVSERIGARRLLTVDDAGSTLHWWSFAGEVPSGAAEVVSAAARPEWLRLAIGPAGRGLTGFRDSHRGARLAASVGRMADRGDVWAYEDVALLGLLLGSPPDASQFVRRELGGLLGDGDRVRELRDTVRAFLRSSHARTQVARSLHISPTTVAYRVRQAEDLLGRSVDTRAVDLRVALDLHHGFSTALGFTEI